MSKAGARRKGSLLARGNEPLFGIVEEGDAEIVRYFTTANTDESGTAQRVQRALELAGAWSDLDWDEAEAELDRIRHQSEPTPPITDL